MSRAQKTENKAMKVAEKTGCPYEDKVEPENQRGVQSSEEKHFRGRKALPMGNPETGGETVQGKRLLDQILDVNTGGKI